MNIKTLGKNIRKARECKHLTISELAELSHVPAQTLGRIERGDNSASVHWISQLAETLKVSISTLFNEKETLHPSFHFRGDTPVTLEFKKNIEKILHLYGHLEDICQAKKYYSFPLDIPLFTFSKENIEEAASLTREVLGIRYAIVYDWFHLLESNGVRIIAAHLPKETCGFSYANPSDRTITFFINHEETFERKLFTLIHELGHVIFHQGGTKYNSYLPFLSEAEIETAANYFASCVLMPEKTVKTTIANLGITINNWSYEILLSLKSRFGVSTQSFLTRLFELGLIYKKQYEQFEAQIFDYYKIHEFAEPLPGAPSLQINQRIKDLILIGETRTLLKSEAESIAEEFRKSGVVL